MQGRKREHDLVLRRLLSFMVATLVAITGSVILPPAPVAAAPPYPDVLPDFTHADRPHTAEYQPTNGRTARPLLIIAVQFTDEPWPAAKTAAWINARFFGPAYPNVRGYFRSQSRDQTDFWPAPETHGTANDGVVRVTVGSRAQYNALSESARHRRALSLADPLVDYRRFDANADRRVTTRELAIVPMWQDPPGATGCGATRAVGAGPTFDGMNVDHQEVAIVGSNANLETIYHELMHATFGVGRDWYAYGIDGYDPMQSTCQGGDFQVGVGSWNAMHLGWSAPTVVNRDGYVDVMRWDHRALGRAYLLYDPAKGTDNYFLVEHRRRGPGGYDADAGDNGLNIWRVNETRYWDDPGTGRLPISRIRPCGEPRACHPDRYFDAWDPTDVTTPQRETDLRWEDGALSRLAIRAVTQPGTNGFQRVYFDVPGPGALVDCFARTGPGHQQSATVRAGESGALLLPVQNTSDVAGYVDTSLQGFGSTRTGTVYLGAKQRTNATFAVNVPAGTAPGRYTVVARSTWHADQRYGSYCYATVDVQAPQNLWGYVYSPQPSSSIPPASGQGNSTGAVNTVDRVGVGQYRVRFARLGGSGGTVQVTAHHRDLAGANCVSSGWYPQLPPVSGPADLAAWVRCFDGTGQFADSGFSASFTRPLTSQGFGYVWADQPATASYTPDRSYQFNATGAVNTITRQGVGTYTVQLPGLAGSNVNGGSVAVTAYGGDATNCRVGYWYPSGGALHAQVLCRRGATPADHQFTLTFADRISLLGTLGRPVAYAWVDQPTAAQSVPSTWYQHHSGGRQVTVGRVERGYYVVYLPGLGVDPARRGWATVTAYGGDARCKLDGLYPDSQGQRALVWCHDSAARGVDSLFTVNYLG